MAVVRLKKEINQEKLTINNSRSTLEYLNLLSMLNIVDVNHLSDVSKQRIYNRINLSKTFLDQGDTTTAYDLLSIEYENIKESKYPNKLKIFDSKFMQNIRSLFNN